MADTKRDVYTAVGMTAYAFIRGLPYTTELLRTQLQLINGLHLMGGLESNEYDYYADILTACIKFFEPTQPTE